MPEFLEGMEASDSDSDLEQDLASAHLQRRILRHSSSGSKTAFGSTTLPIQPAIGSIPGIQIAVSRHLDCEKAVDGASGSQESSGQAQQSGEAAHGRTHSKAEALSAALQSWQMAAEENSALRDSALRDLALGVVELEAGIEQGGEPGALPVAASSSMSQQATSAKALAAVWTLLEACITHPEAIVVTTPPAPDGIGATEATVAEASVESDTLLDSEPPEGTNSAALFNLFTS